MSYHEIKQYLEKNPDSRSPLIAIKSFENFTIRLGLNDGEYEFVNYKTDEIGHIGKTMIKHGREFIVNLRIIGIGDCHFEMTISASGLQPDEIKLDNTIFQINNLVAINHFWSKVSFFYGCS